MWAMCLRCMIGTGGCKITQQNRTNCKLCRYQVWYTIRQGNVTKKCCSENYGLLKFSFDRIYWNSILPSQIPTPKMKLDWIGCFSKAVKAPAPIVNLIVLKFLQELRCLGCFKKCCFSAVLRLGWNQKRWIWELQLHKKLGIEPGPEVSNLFYSILFYSYNYLSYLFYSMLFVLPPGSSTPKRQGLKWPPQKLLFWAQTC